MHVPNTRGRAQHRTRMQILLVGAGAVRKENEKHIKVMEKKLRKETDV